MLFGYSNTMGDKLVTVVTAGRTVPEFEMWYQDFIGVNTGENYIGHRATGFMDHMTNVEFKGFKHPAYIFEHDSEEQRQAFQNAHSIVIEPPKASKGRHDDMIELQKQTMMTPEELNDRRSIGEIEGLTDENDKWDPRTPEERAADREKNSKVDELRKRMGDHVTGSSFDPNPRGADDDDGLHVTKVSIGQGGNVSVSGIKGLGSGKGGTSSNGQSQTPSIDDLVNQVVDGLTDSEVAITESDIRAKLEAAGFEADKINKAFEGVDVNDAEQMKDLNERVDTAIKKRKINEALKPLDGQLGDDEIIAEVTTKLDAIPELTNTERADLIEGVKKKLAAPRPKSTDYVYALNPELTENKMMRGAGTPIFQFEVNKYGPNKGKFGLRDLILMLEHYGFSMVSYEIYSYEKGTLAEAQQKLKDAGFIEDISILPQKVRDAMAGGQDITVSGDVGPKVTPKPKSTLSPADFAKALGGNGTSTMSGTGSYGNEVVGMTSFDESVTTAGMVGDKGASLPVDNVAKEVAFEDLPVEVKNLIGSDLSDGRKIRLGAYTGHVVGSLHLFPQGNGYTVRDDLCINTRDIGTTTFMGVSVRSIARFNEKEAAYVVYEGAGNGAWVVIRIS